MINAILMMLVVGALMGLILGFSDKVFYVAPDTRVEDVTKMLPGYNCGGCGYPGCSGLAEALVNKEAEVTNCKPSSLQQKEAIKEYLSTH